MDNLIIEKVWQDGNLYELKIEGVSQYVNVFQTCYIQDTKIADAGKMIAAFLENPQDNCYVEFGIKEGNYTPAFSMDIFPPELSGKIKIEVDFEIADNDSRSHRCKFFISSELGAVERFAKGMEGLSEGSIESIKMFE